MRRNYLDNIRFGTIIAVVVYHVIYLYNSVGVFGAFKPFSETQYQDGLLYLIYPWFMLLMFIVAGVSSRLYLENHTIKEFISSRTSKLLVPSTLGLFVWCWIQGYISMTMSGTFEQGSDIEKTPKLVMYIIMCLSGTGVLWFIQLLWVFSLLLAVIRKFEKGKLYEVCKNTNIIVLLLLAVPVFLSGLVLNMPVISVYRVGFYGLGFLLGYFVFAHEEVIDRLVKVCVPLAAAAVVLGIVFMIYGFGQNYTEQPLMTSVPDVLFAWITCLAIFGFAKRWFNGSTKFTQYMTKRSFGLYMFHYLPMSAAALLLDKYTNTPAVLCYIIIAAAAFGGGLLLSAVIPKIPVLRWFMMGIKSKNPSPAKAVADK